MSNGGLGKEGDNTGCQTFARMYFVNGQCNLTTQSPASTLPVLLQHFQNTPRGRSERFAWASCSTRIPPRRTLHHSQPAASLLQNAYSASLSFFPPLALQLQFTSDTPIPSLGCVCVVLVLCAFSRVSTCVFRGASCAAVGDGGDSLEATHWGDAIRLASALMEGASLCCQSERDSQYIERCHQAAPLLQPHGAEARVARQSSPIPLVHACLWRSQHPSSLPSATPRRTF